ncbi:MAG TPA: glycosyltransferase family 39 protein [Patescibacteria group bacterium]|nr:glycosyltransferase family 39 protein [Patescibacteria group bacterium]
MNFKKIFIKNRILFLLLAIVIVAIVLRFANYQNRFGLAGDQARDVLIIREALKLHKLPIVGPFSASGPYVFGPIWFWIFSLPVALFPKTFLAPWIFQSLLFVLMIPIMFFIGKKMIDETFGIIISLLTALSPSIVKISTNLIFSALVCFLSLVVIYYFISHLKNKKIRSFYLLIFFISIAINIHFEAIPLIVLIPFAYFARKKTLSNLIVSAILFVIPFAPLIYFNNIYNNYEINNIMQSVVFKKTATHSFLPIQILKNELNFSISLFPNIWNSTISGYSIPGLIMFLITLAILTYALSKNTINKQIEILSITFLIMLGIVGDYNGTLFKNLTAFTFPFVVIICGWVCYFIYKQKQYLGIGILAMILISSLINNFYNIKNSTNIAATSAVYWEHQLYKKYPNQNFAVFSYSTNYLDKSLPLSLYLDVAGRIDANGRKIGIANFGDPVNYLVSINGPDRMRIYDFAKTPDRELTNQNFSENNPSYVYENTVDWYKK